MITIIMIFLINNVLPAYTAWLVFPESNKNKVVWVVLSFLFGWLGLIVTYLFDKFMNKKEN